MSGSHFIKDEEGNYHHLNDEEYSQMQHDKAILFGPSAMVVGALGMWISSDIPSLFWIGLGFAVIGLIALKKISWSSGEFWGYLIGTLVLIAGAYFGIRWVLNHYSEEKKQDQTEIVEEVSVSTQTVDEFTLSFSNYYAKM